MTSRERFLCSMTGGRPDRMFRYEHGPWPTTRERWLAEGLPADVGFGAFFQMDPIVRIMINSGYCDSPYHPKFIETIEEETGQYRVYRDGDGIRKKVLKEQTDTSMPQFLAFPVESRADWERIRARLNPDDDAARIGNTARLEAACGPDVPTMLPICGAFGHPRNLFGDEGLAYVIFDDPALLDEVLDNWRDLYVQLIRRLTGTVRVDCVLIWEDMCYRNGPLISPEHFRRFMSPRYGELIAECRRCGVEAILVDTDGDCLKMIPAFLDVGVDALMPFEVQAGMDVVDIARRWPGLSIMGGLDKRVLAADRPRDNIRREVDRVLPFFVERGGFIPTLDHTVPPNVPLDRFQFYLDCLRSHEPAS